MSGKLLLIDTFSVDFFLCANPTLLYSNGFSVEAILPHITGNVAFQSILVGNR